MIDEHLIFKLIEILQPAINYTNGAWVVSYNNGLLQGSGGTLKEAMENFWMQYAYGPETTYDS